MAIASTEEDICGKNQKKKLKSTYFLFYQVKKFLVEQFACYYLTWMLIETEKSQLDSKVATVNKLVELLESDVKDLERQEELLKNLPDLTDVNEDLILNEDVCVANIHDSLGLFIFCFIFLSCFRKVLDKLCLEL